MVNNSIIDGEVWKDIKDHKNYMVSNLGRVRSKDRSNGIDSKGRVLFKPGTILRFAVDSAGYYMARLFEWGVKPKKIHSKKVHRLVAEAFIPNPENKPQVNHKKGNRKDNRATELEWATSEENMYHAMDILKSLKRIPIRAIKLNTGEVEHFESVNKAVKKLGVQDKSVRHVLIGKANHTHGYYFEYAGNTVCELKIK